MLTASLSNSTYEFCHDHRLHMTNCNLLIIMNNDTYFSVKCKYYIITPLCTDQNENFSIVKCFGYFSSSINFYKTFQSLIKTLDIFFPGAIESS